MTTGMGLASPADLDAVSRTICAAFFGDPVWSWAFPDPDHRAANYPRWWNPLIEQGFENGGVWTTPGATAATVWVPPGCAELSPEREDAYLAMARSVHGDRADLVLEGLLRFEENHPHDQPHYYLSLAATHPDHAGQKLGVGLIGDVLAQVVDPAGMPAYLESSNPVNHARYERLGFEPIGSFEMPEGGPPILCMWRFAQS